MEPYFKSKSKTKTYITYVSYKDRSIAYQCGARWDSDEEMWYTFDSNQYFMVKFCRALVEKNKIDMQRIFDKRKGNNVNKIK